MQIFYNDRTLEFLSYACPALLAMAFLSLGQMRRPLLFAAAVSLGFAIWIVSERL